MTTTTPEEPRLPTGEFTLIGWTRCDPVDGAPAEGGVRYQLDVFPSGGWSLVGTATTGGRLVVELAGEAADPRLPVIASLMGGWLAVKGAD